MKTKRWIPTVIALLLILSFAGCSAEESYSTTDSVYRTESSNGLVYGDAMEAPSQSAGGNASVAQNQKLIRTMRIQAQTQDMDPLLAQLDSKIRQLGGYVESKNVYNGGITGNISNRHAELAIRIPADSLDDFADHIRGQSNVVSLNESVDDITLQYVAVESRVKALETEQQRLLELLEKAETMSDLLKIESRLTEVRTELEQVMSQIRIYDNKVDYATLHLTVTEVKEYTEPEVEKTVWQRIGEGLSGTWNAVVTFLVELFVFLVSSLPVLIPVGVIGFFVLRGVKARKKKQSVCDPCPPENQDPQQPYAE